MKLHITILGCLAAGLLTGCGNHPQPGSPAAQTAAPATGTGTVAGIAPNSKEQEIIQQARQSAAIQAAHSKPAAPGAH